MAPFTGRTDYQMDDRNRVAIPPRWREHFEAPSMMTFGRAVCIKAYTQRSYDDAEKRVNAIDPDSEEGDDERRRFYGTAYPIPRDGQGRFVIEKALMDYARLKKDVAVIGLGDHFEIWDRAELEAYEAERKGRK